jgi:hypothetical protein
MSEMVWVDKKQIGKVAARLKAHPPRKMRLDFYTIPGKEGVRDKDKYPDLNHAQVLDFFSFACLHNYGFWYSDENGYLEPLDGQLDERRGPLPRSWRISGRPHFLAV